MAEIDLTQLPAPKAIEEFDFETVNKQVYNVW